MRRLRKILINPQVFFNIISSGQRIAFEGIPSGSRLVSAYLEGGQFCFCIEHETFDMVQTTQIPINAVMVKSSSDIRENILDKLAELIDIAESI